MNRSDEDMSSGPSDSPFDVLARLDGAARRAVAGQLDRAAFLTEAASSLAALRALSTPETLDDVGPYLPVNLGAVEDALTHALETGVALGPEQYGALDRAVGAAVRRAHLSRSPDEVADELRRAGLLPPGWRRRGGPAPIPPPMAPTARGHYIDETPDPAGAPAPSGAARPTPVEDVAAWVAPLRLLGLGWAIAISLVAGILLGRLADQALGTAPLGLFVGVALGAAVGYHSARSLIRSMDRRA